MSEPKAAEAQLLRVIFVSAASAAWYDAHDAERDQVLAELVSVCRRWRDRDDARFIVSVDDDLLLAGDPRGFQRWSAYLVFDVDNLESIAAMVDDYRRASPRLDKYFTVSAIVGRPFWPIE